MKLARNLSLLPEIPLIFSSFFLNFFWEMIQTPLYDDVSRKTYLQILISRLHCSLGDVLILLGAYWIVVRVTRNRYWLIPLYPRHLSGFTLLGLGYTIVSEWINIDIRTGWGYSPLMPRLPFLGTGLTPFLQWLILPPVITEITRKFLSESMRSMPSN